jgi:hypothetical protein
VLVQRRSVFKLLGVGLLAAAAGPRPAYASRSVAVSLAELVRRSRRIAVATSMGGEGRWESVGERRRIVTYHRVRIDELFDGDSVDGEVVVRTLGGRVGEIGQVVYGEAVLLRGQPSVLFLHNLRADVHAVTARAQGHFPLLADEAGVRHLRASPHRARLIDTRDSAAARLVGRSVADAKRLILETSRRVR